MRIRPFIDSDLRMIWPKP